uniref:Guanylate cyclase domain-containing protein n=1 Tax=Steinernema glaseri TaxID=37863 RepID=A0A1I7ZJY1_9BILA
MDMFMHGVINKAKDKEIERHLARELQGRPRILLSLMDVQNTEDSRRRFERTEDGLHREWLLIGKALVRAQKLPGAEEVAAFLVLTNDSLYALS